jgi:threonine aldolase
MDGARFANAAAFLGCSPAEAAGPIDVLSFGGIKNGGMNADAIVFFNPGQADLARWRRKRAGHLQSKGRFLAAQIHALLDGDLWLANAAAANDAAQAVAAGARSRLLHPVEANELFVRLDAGERAALRAQGFAFYDWDDHSARMVTSWNTRSDDAEALARALARL